MLSALKTLDAYADRIVDLVTGRPPRLDERAARRTVHKLGWRARLGLARVPDEPEEILPASRRMARRGLERVADVIAPRRRPPPGLMALGAAAAAGLGYAAAKFFPGLPPGEALDPREAERTRSHSGPGAAHLVATEAHRGRTAESPFALPLSGWKDVAWRVYREFGADRLLAVAAGVTFYALLAIFPAIAALVSSYSLFADASTINEHLAGLGGLLPSGALEIIGEQIKRINENGDTTLGLTFIVGLGISLWSANAGMKAIIDALNLVYEEEEKRGFVALNAVSLAFTLGALTLVIAAMVGIVVLPVAFNVLGLGGGAWLLALFRWPALLAIVILGLGILYRYGPSRTKARWPWVIVGAGVAGTVWIIASMLFSWYVSSFGSYNETYGSLGAAVGFMTWIWLSATIVLLGAEINAEIEHQTSHDTTVSGGRPMGTRGAQMADTLGESSSAAKA